MKRRKILLVLLLCITMILGMTAGCGKRENTKNEPEADASEVIMSEPDVSEEDETEEPESTEAEGENDEVGVKEPEPESTGTEVDEPETETTVEPEDDEAAGMQESDLDEPEIDEPETDEPEGTPVEIHGALHVDGTQLMDSNNEPMQLRGVSTAGLSWFPQFANKDAFQTMYEEWGINVVRLAMYTAESDGYCVGDENNRDKLRKLVKTCVEDAADLGLYVIVDWHILRDEDPNKYKDQAIAFFDEMSELYADYDNVIYEICNEPNGSATWSKVKSYAEEVIPTIRANDDDAVIIVGTPTWSQDVDKAAADPIKGYDNIMYALHFYAATHKEDLRNRMTNTINAGLPIFVSEFGICDASGNGNIDYYQADEWIRTMNEYGVSYCIWNLSNKDESSSLLAPSTNAIAGWTEKQLSASGKWFVEMMQGNLESVGTSGITGGSASNQSQGNTGGSGNQSSTSDSQSQGNDCSQSNTGGYTPPTSIAQEVTIQDCKITVSSSNTWGDGTETFYQLATVIDNQSGKTQNDWAITVIFSGNVTVSQNWCCTASATGNQLKITPESWNATINSGSNISDIGVILSSGTTVTIEKIEFSATTQ